jgi:hypothetical protein
MIDLTRTITNISGSSINERNIVRKALANLPEQTFTQHKKPKEKLFACKEGTFIKISYPSPTHPTRTINFPTGLTPQNILKKNILE